MKTTRNRFLVGMALLFALGNVVSLIYSVSTRTLTLPAGASLLVTSIVQVMVLYLLHVVQKEWK